jgi:hypothetical protein
MLKNGFLLFIMSLCFAVSVSSGPLRTAGKSIKLRKHRPDVFISFVKFGRRTPLESGESDQGVWLKLHNNTRWPIWVPSFGAPSEYGEAGLHYDVRRFPRPLPGVTRGGSGAPPPWTGPPTRSQRGTMRKITPGGSPSRPENQSSSASRASTSRQNSLYKYPSTMDGRTSVTLTASRNTSCTLALIRWKRILKTTRKQPEACEVRLGGADGEPGGRGGAANNSSRSSTRRAVAAQHLKPGRCQLDASCSASRSPRYPG